VPDLASPAREELTEFVAAVAHDLLEPLSTVNGYLDLFLRRYGRGLDDGGRELLDAAQSGAQGMQALVQGLLELTGATPPAEERGPVDLGAIVAQIVLRLSNALEAAGATLTVDEPLPAVTGDPVQLARLFQNLVANALKFRRQDEPPMVRVSASAALSAGVWELAVTDNGIGIAPDKRELVFATFKRLHSRSVYPGSGLGLAICKRIVEDHHGRIWVTDGPGGTGASFRFTLPA
jgi:signal transduction histidine kinase